MQKIVSHNDLAEQKVNAAVGQLDGASWDKNTSRRMNVGGRGVMDGEEQS